MVTMTDYQLHILQLIIAVLFQCLTSYCTEGTTCSTCTAEIHGPYLENQTRELHSVEMVRATDSNPAVIVCSYICCERGYEFELKIDILDLCEQPQRREPIQGSQVYQDDIHDFRVVPIINNTSTCDQENREIRKYRIHVGSSDVPTLIAKCIVKHFPNLPSSTENSTECSGSSTLAIIPGYSSPESSTCISPSTNTVSPSSTLEPTPVPGPVEKLLSRNNTCTNDCINLHKIYGSILAIIVTVFIAAVVILLAVIFHDHLTCTRKLKLHRQLCTCKKIEDEVETTLIKTTVAWDT